MRRSIYIVFLSVGMLVQLSAQDQFYTGKFHLGVKGGFNAVAIAPQNTYGQAFMDYKVPVRPMAGIVMMYKVGLRSQVVLEADYQVMGQIYESERKGLYKNIKQDYIVVPVLYRYILNPEYGRYNNAATFYNVNWFITAGVQPGYLFNSTIRYEVNGTQADFATFIAAGGNPDSEAVNMEAPAEDRELYNAFDLSLVGGGGFFMRFSERGQVFLEIRGGFSIMDVNAPKWQIPNGSGNYFGSYNMFIGLHGGVAYRLF